MDWKRTPTLILLAIVLVVGLVLPAAAVTPHDDDAPASASTWSLLADWLAGSLHGIADAWDDAWDDRTTRVTGDIGLGIDPDGTDPDPDDTDPGTEPAPNDDTTTDGPPAT